MSKRLSVLVGGGLRLPPTDELSSSYLTELLSFADYVLDVEEDMGNDVPYGTGLYESDIIRHWYKLFDSEPTPLLTEPVNMGEISDTLCAEMKLSLYQTRAHKDFLNLYVSYLEAKRELSKAYYNMREDSSVNIWDNDYLGTTHQLMMRIIQFQNRDYNEMPTFRYNDVTKKLEITYQLDAETVADMMRRGYN